MNHDEALLDDVACLALGVLPLSEAERVAEHVRSCDECRAAYSDLRPVADAIGFVEMLAPETNDLEARRRKNAVMRVVRDDAMAAVVPAAVADERPTVAARARPPYLSWGLAAAAILVAVLVGADDLRTRTAADNDASRVALDAEAQNARIATLQSQLSSQTKDANERVAALLGAGGKHFGVPQGEVVTSDGRVTIAVKLPPPPAGKTYQAWTLARGAKAVAPSVLFVPGADGVAVVKLPENAANLVAVAISLEPAGGSKAPSTTSAFIRKLS